MSKSQVTISLDCMGGDFGTPIVVPAALDALKKYKNLSLILVGDQVAIEALGQTLAAPKPEHSLRDGQTVKVVLRPEAIHVVETGGQYQGIVRWSSYRGNAVEYEVEVAGQRLSVVNTDPRHVIIYPQGQEVSVQVLEDCLYILPE